MELEHKRFSLNVEDPISINSGYEMCFDQQAPELKSVSCVSMLHGMRGRIFKTPFQRVLIVRRKLKVNYTSSIIDDDNTELTSSLDQPDDLKLRYRPFGSTDMISRSELKKRKTRT
jgi:hypothetical protein